MWVFEDAIGDEMLWVSWLGCSKHWGVIILERLGLLCTTETCASSKSSDLRNLGDDLVAGSASAGGVPVSAQTQALAFPSNFAE